MKTNFFFTLVVSAIISSKSISQAQNAMLPANEDAPVYCTKSILIHATPEKVWRVLTNIDEWNTWLSSVTRSKLNGELKPNATFDFKTGKTKIHSKLHTVEANSIIGWTGKVYGVSAVHNWILKDVDGTTEVIVAESMEGLSARLFKKSLNKSLEKDVLKSLFELKKACEK